MADVHLFIGPDGSITFLHDDDMALALRGLGTSQVRRASHVEPTADGRWAADLAPSGHDVTLGPFATRREALAAEAAWLVELLATGQPPAAAPQAAGDQPPTTGRDQT